MTKYESAQDDFVDLMNRLLTALDEIDKSLVGIAMSVDDLK